MVHPKASLKNFLIFLPNNPSLLYCYQSEVIAKVRNLPFDKLRVNGLRLKSFTFSVRGELVEPQKNTFAIGSSVHNYIDIGN
jgi:hypothetical protein